MKRLVPLGLAVAIMLAAVAVSSPTDVNAQSAGLVSSLLNRMERNRQTLKSLRASVSMEKYNAQIHDSDKYSGYVLYVPGAGRSANVRLEWQRPQHEILAVSNGAYTLYRPRTQTAWVGRAGTGIGKQSRLFDYLTMSKQQLTARFDIQDVRSETLWGGVSTVHVTLIPKSGSGFSSKYAEVWVDDGGMPVQVKMVERNDDSTTVRLLNIERNAGISSDQFQLQLDGSVKKIQS